MMFGNGEVDHGGLAREVVFVLEEVPHMRHYHKSMRRDPQSLSPSGAGCIIYAYMWRRVLP